MFRFFKNRPADAVTTYEVAAEWVGREGNGRTAYVTATSADDAVATVMADPGRYLHTCTEPASLCVALAA